MIYYLTELSKRHQTTSFQSSHFYQIGTPCTGNTVQNTWFIFPKQNLNSKKHECAESHCPLESPSDILLA